MKRNMICFCGIISMYLAASSQGVAQQQLPKPLMSGPKSEASVAVQTMRWHALDGNVNAFTFRNLDQIFITRTVPRAGSVWQLPKAETPLTFEYTFNGVTRRADEALERTYTNALIILKDGVIVSEKYRNNSGADDKFIVWSVTKSIVSILVGVAVQEGRIASVDDQITKYLPELKGGGYDGVTVKQVLEMRSGVQYEERYDFDKPGVAATNHIESLVKNTQRFVDVARTVPRLHQPGAIFEYKTIDTAVLGLLVERVSGGSNIAAYMSQRLWEPLGAESDGYFIMDGKPAVGREFSGGGYNATARDLARIGQMMLNGGTANGRQILSQKWVTDSTKPTEEPAGPLGYGFQWWTLGDGSYSALGLQGQYIFVDPKTKTVIVKLSYFPPDDVTSDGETIAFLKAASKWNMNK